MLKDIRSQLHLMTFVLGLMACLGVWKFDFIITAIMANLFLNLTIFGTFAFGAYFAYRNVVTLKNECVAYDALRVDYEDTLNSDAQETADPSWRYYRCTEDAIIFAKPKILEQPFHIISEEMAKTNHLSMSTGSMQNLLDSIDERLDDRRSLIQYVTGILVFLGLIGTFVGLMVTLGSVGDIIGGLDLSGSAGASAIQGLMQDLKVPLGGMATGFSSSLFGLITSLALGLMARFASKADRILKMNFETWIAGVAKVDSEGGSGSTHSPVTMENQLSLMYRVARLALISNARVSSSVERMVDSTYQMRTAQIETHSAMQSFADSLLKMANSQTLTNESLVQIGAMMETRTELTAIMDELKNDAVNQRTAYKGVNKYLVELATRQAKIQEDSKDTIKHIARRDEIKWLMNDVQESLGTEFRQLNIRVENLGGFLTEIDRNLHSNTTDIRLTQDKLFEESQGLKEELTAAIAQSKFAMEEARKLEPEQTDQSIMGIRKRLSGTFHSEPEATEQIEDQPKKKKRSFNPFRRRA